MPHTLHTLRETAQPTSARFLSWQPGCWLQYYDDTPARDASKALSTRRFDPAVASRKQQDHCAVGYSLQAFGETRTKEGLLCFRNMGVDVDLVPADERGVLPEREIDRRKDDHLANCLGAFPLQPHWLVETRHGFHLVFRVQPLRADNDIRRAMEVNRRLVAALRGDENAVLLTQVLRVPGTYQFKDPRGPFLCRLLMDNAGTIAPYDFRAIGEVLAQRGDFSNTKGVDGPGAEKAAHPRASWQDGLLGVPQGRRNGTAAAIIGAILGRLPEYLWETAGWGGLKEWNTRNPVPLPERELRGVFESIARRERAARQSGQRAPAIPPVRLRPEVRIAAADRAEGWTDPSGASGTHQVLPHRR